MALLSVRARYARRTLTLVDQILADLRRPDGMFVGRRADAGHAYAVVIQAGEDGRRRVQVDLESPDLFMTAAQSYVTEVYGRPVPACPLHDHALVARVREGAPEWVCPDGGWSCAVGDHEERTWPPDLDGGHLAEVLCRRLARPRIKGWHTLGFRRRDARWVAEVEIWPMDPALVEALTRAAAPLPVAVEAVDRPPVHEIVV